MTIPAIYAALWHRKLFIFIVTAAVTGAAIALSLVQTKEYTASSLVRIEQRVQSASDVFGALQTGERLARTYAQIAETRGVTARIRESVGDGVPAEAITIDANQVANLELLQLSVTYRDPVVAAKVANAAPEALAEFVRSTGQSRDLITTVETATVPSSPSSPDVPLNVALGVVLGLILAAGLALLFEALSDRIPGQEELEKLTGHAIIATIPNLDFRPAKASQAAAQAPEQPRPTRATRPATPAPAPAQPSRSAAAPQPGAGQPTAPASGIRTSGSPQVRSERPWREDA